MARPLVHLALVLIVGCALPSITADDPVGNAPGGAGGDGGGTGGSGGEAGGGGVAGQGPCGSVSLLHDEFDDGALDPVFEVFAQQGVLYELAGDLHIELSATGTIRWAEATSERFYDLTDDAIMVEVNEVPDNPAQALLDIVVDSQNYLRIHASKMRFSATLETRPPATGQSDTDNFITVDYDPTDHRWWRIREGGGEIHVEVSPDGSTTTWTSLGSRPIGVAFPVNHVSVRLGLASDLAGPATAKFGKISGAHEVPPWCPASTLLDPFMESIAAPDYLWQRTESTVECTPTEPGNGTLFINRSMGNHACGYGSSSAFDLTGSSMTVRVAARDANIPAYLLLDAHPRNDIELDFAMIHIDTDDPEELKARVGSGGSWADLASVVLDSLEHAWWRIREADGIIHFETSPDNSTWTELAATAAPWPVTALDVFLGVRSDGSTAAGAVSFADLNAP